MNWMTSLACALPLAALGLRLAAQPLASVDSFFDDQHDDTPYRIRGTVADTYVDEVDPRFVYFTLEGAERQILCSVRIDSSDPSEMLALSGRRVELRGVVRTASSLISRAYLGKMFLVEGTDDISLLGEDLIPSTYPSCRSKTESARTSWRSSAGAASPEASSPSGVAGTSCCSPTPDAP